MTPLVTRATCAATLAASLGCAEASKPAPDQGDAPPVAQAAERPETTDPPEVAALEPKAEEAATPLAEPEADAPDTSDMLADADPTGPSRLRPVPFPLPPELLACERDWLLAKQPTPEVTNRCVDVFLADAYGDVPSADSLDLDPDYGSKLELRYTGSQLRDMTKLVASQCTPKSSGDPGRCERTQEYLSGMAERKAALYDDVNVDGIEAALAQILAGERLGDADLWLSHEGLGFSALMLWKLEAAVVARHGRAFADEDLDAFFYSARHPSWAELGLPELVASKAATETVKLDDADRHNLALIARARAVTLGERERDATCFVGERVVFACRLTDDRRVSLCGSDTERKPKLDAVVLRALDDTGAITIPNEIVSAIAEVARVTVEGERTLVDVSDDINEDRARIERDRSGGGDPRYRVTLFGVSDDAVACASVQTDALDDVGASL